MTAMMNLSSSILFLFLATPLVNCGGTGSNTAYESCISFNMSDQESASYSFTNAGLTDIVTVTVGTFNGGYNINYTENHQNNSASITTNCGKPISGSLTKKVSLILFDGFQWIPTKNSANEVITTVWTNKCAQSSETLTVDAGSYSVQKCILIPQGSNLNIINTVRYKKINGDGVNSKPFSGVVKEIINFRDGSSAIIQLTKWNNL